jgi:hypothetical protein
MNVYNLGEQIFLYATFENDLTNISFLNEPVVEIFFLKDNDIVTVLKEKMQTTDYINYYYNYTIPTNLDLGQYQVVYTGFVKGKQNKIFENFFIINSSNQGMNPIRLYGYIYDSKSHKNVNDVEIKVTSDDGIFYYTTNNLIGQWEVYVYPGNYNFLFKKRGYKTQEVSAIINDSLQDIEFNNVVMEEQNDDLLGDGIYEIKDQYIMKNGQPIEDLTINIYNVNNLNDLIVDTKTNSDGEWIAYLDEGLYLLKVFGTVFSKEFNKTFRLKVNNNGKFTFDDISKNKASEETIFYPNGSGSCKYIDYLYDKNNKPIVDVQVNILSGNDILYQSYTDLNGKFEFNLDEGKYTFEFYHPSFKTITKQIEISGDYTGEQLQEG